MLVTIISSTPVLAITNSQRKALDGGALYVNTEDRCVSPGTTTQNTSSGVGGGVYLMGDSWMHGLTKSSPSISDALTTKGYTVTGINARSGRSITGVGTGHDGLAPQSGLEAADADAALIEAANKVVIVLGTNSHGYDSRIPDLIDKLQGKSVYWVNTSANFKDIVASTSENNAAIAKHSTDVNKPYTVIDWFSKVYPGGDPTKIDVNATSPLMANDHIHPSGAGYKELVSLIVNSISTSSSANTVSPGGCTCSTTNTTQLSSNKDYEANEKLAWDFFRTKMSLSENATAGVMGNLLRENGGRMDPENLSGVGDVPFMPVASDGVTPDISVYGNKGYGLAQWTTKSRQLNFVGFSLGKGPAPFNTPRRNGEMQYQLDYIKYELESGYFKPSYSTITSPNVSLKDAAEIIDLNYETPKSVIEPRRSDYPSDAEYKAAYDHYLVTKPESLASSVSFANAMLLKFAGRTEGVSTQGGCSNGPSTDSTISGAGVNLKVGGVQYFSQCDPAWKTFPYGNNGDTVCSSGCGPTATAMILSTLKNDPSITPQIIAEWGAKNGTIIYRNGVSEGSYNGIASRAAKVWGLQSRVIKPSVAELQQVFDEGGYVFINVGPGDFTDGGHYIILRGFDSSGKLLVSDPNDGQPGQGRYLKKTQTAWDFAQVMSQTRYLVGILP
jgi:hypothetical protein